MDRNNGGAPQPEPNATDSRSTTVVVNDPHGLHLRTGRDVVRVASQFQAEITARNLSRDSQQVDVKSILQLMQLQARQGHVIRLDAAGPDADAALEALAALFA